jgi:transposase
MALTLTADERTELERSLRSRKIRAEDARRAQVILMLADGASFTTITATVGCYPDYVSRWKQRFEGEGLAGLRAKYCRQPARVRTPAMEARFLPRPGSDHPSSTHWSTRKLAKVLGISQVLVPACGVAPGCSLIPSNATMLSDDPEFEQKAADVIGLYLNPPQHAVVFAADEKTAIQAQIDHETQGSTSVAPSVEATGRWRERGRMGRSEDCSQVTPFPAFDTGVLRRRDPEF